VDTDFDETQQSQARKMKMKQALKITMAALLCLSGTAALAQGSQNLQNPGTSTTPGLSQPTSPASAPNITITNIQNLPVGVGTQAGQTTTPQTPLGFSSINVTPTVAIPSKFATSNVLSTQTPQPQVVVTPQPPTSQTSLTTPAQPTTAPPGFLSPSPQFVPIQVPKPFNPPSTNGFVAK
jgi:hypothetical protein